MSLLFSDGYVLSRKTLDFYAWDGTRLITVAIPIAAISRRFGVATSDKTGLRAAYLAHRAEIHRLAAATYAGATHARAASAKDGGGRLRLRAADVAELAPSYSP